VIHEPDQGIALGCALQQASIDKRLQWAYSAEQALESRIGTESSLVDTTAVKDVVPFSLGFARPVLRPVNNIPKELLPVLQRQLYPSKPKTGYPPLLCRRYEVTTIVAENDAIGQSYTRNLTSAAKDLSSGVLRCPVTQGNSLLVRYNFQVFGKKYIIYT
jgi:hypothetical protein